MSKRLPKELDHARELMDQAKLDDSLEIIEIFLKNESLTQEDQLSALLLKGRIYGLTNQLKKLVAIGELAYSLSQELRLVPESIEALLFKASIIFLGENIREVGKALPLILEAERLLSTLSDQSPVKIAMLKLNLMFTKSWIYTYKGELNKALDSAMKALTLGEKLNSNYWIGNVLYSIANIYDNKGEPDTALEYAMKSLKLFEKLDLQGNIADSLEKIGNLYYHKGNLNKALEFSKKALSIKKIYDKTKIYLMDNLGRIYRDKGELNKALKYTEQSIKLDENLNVNPLSRSNMGVIYMMKGEDDQAIKYFKQSLVLSEKIGNTPIMVIPLLYLLLINLDTNYYEQAQQYLKRLEKLFNQNEIHPHGYILGKALMLKASNRMRDHGDAERLLKQIVEDEIIWPQFHILSIVSLCDLLLKELSIYNNPKIIDEINPLIKRLLKIAENQYSFSWLAEGKVLQAKLSLIRMNIEEAKKMLTEAQHTAESHGLSLLAQKISKEHDNLLEQIDHWEKLKTMEAPMEDRIKLASVDGVIGRLQGKHAVDPPELVDEEPILLLIMDNSGATYFNHLFIANWDHSDLFSSFMSAFNTFSSEIFSRSIDRIRIGENTILINPVEPFLTCYVIKGQSYPALQKLSRFTEAIRENSEIWQALEKSVKTSEMLEPNKPPALKTVIDEIFTQQIL